MRLFFEVPLSDVNCDFIYLGWTAGDVFQDRCPIDRSFGNGEFTRRFRILHNVLELAFSDGMPWKAFANAFAEINLQILDEYGSELFLREYKVLDEGLVVLKIGYPSKADSNKIRERLESKTMQLRELELHNIYLKGELKAKDETLARLERVLLPEFSRFEAKSSRIYLDDIQSFQKIRLVDFKSIESFLQVNGYLHVSEDKVQNALENILNEGFHKKDWGGEYNDLYTSNLIFKGARRATAFLLKGNGLRAATMEIKHCGKNGDQLIRLFESPAELFIVQFVGNISEAIVKDVEGKVELLRARGKEAYYCIVNGTDTARLLYAYDLLNI
jgi:hypothetical protein